MLCFRVLLVKNPFPERQYIYDQVPSQLCNSLLHKFSVMVGFRQGPHILEISNSANNRMVQLRLLWHILSMALATTPITMKSIIATKTSVASSSVACLKKNAEIAMLRIATHIPRPIIRIPVSINLGTPHSRRNSWRLFLVDTKPVCTDLPASINLPIR